MLARHISLTGSRNALRTAAAMTLAIFGVLDFAAPAGAVTLYWDTDGSTAGNNASTGANLGGSEIWSTADANWWETSLGTPQVWTDGSDAVFWGTAGAVTASTVSANSLAFKTTGYSVDSGTLTVGGAASSFAVDSNLTATINSTIAGTNTLWKLGPGTLILSNTNNLNTANTIAGGWRIEDGGTLRLIADGSLGAPLPDTARNTVTDIQLNQSTIQAGAAFDLHINRRTKLNTNATTNRGDAVIDVRGNVFRWFGSIQGGVGSLRVTDSTGSAGMLVLGTDKIASVNPFGSGLPGGTVNLTVEGTAVVQTSGQVTPTGGELGAETGAGGAVLAVKLDGGGQIRSESGGYEFQRNLILGPGGGSLDTGAWLQTWTGTVSGPGKLTKWGSSTLVIDNPPSAPWEGGTEIRMGTLQLGRAGSNGLLPGTPANPSSVVIYSGATLRFHRGSNKSFFDIISGAGGITVANVNNAKVRLVSDNTYTGPTTISSGVLMIGQGNPGEPGSIASSVVNNSGTLAFNRVEDLTYAGAISGPGTVEKQAAGTLTLSGTNSYTGATTVMAGSLLVNGVIGDSAVTVTGGTLGGTGTVNGSVTVAAGGSTSAGAGPGVLTVGGGLDLSAGGTNVWELAANSGANPGTDFDQISLTGGNLVLGGASRLLIKFTGSATFPDAVTPFWHVPHSWTNIVLSGSAANPGSTSFAFIDGVSGLSSSVGSFSTSVDSAGSIVLTYTPSVTPVTAFSILQGPGSDLTLSYSGGSGSQFVLLQTNNTVAPLSLWTRLQTNTSSPGTFIITPGSDPQEFYRVKSE